MLTRAGALAVLLIAAGAAPAAAVDTTPPELLSVVRDPGQQQRNKDGLQNWVITFSEPVYGFTQNNFGVSDDPDGFATAVPNWNFPNGNATGAMSIATPSGTGSVQAYVINLHDGAITDAAGNAWTGGMPAQENNGFYVDRDGPHPTIYPDPLTGGVTADSPVRFLLDFTNEEDVDYSTIHPVVSGTAGATTAKLVPPGDGADPIDRIIEVSDMTGPGTVVVSLPDGAFLDTLDNPSHAAVVAPGAESAQYTGAGTPKQNPGTGSGSGTPGSPQQTPLTPTAPGAQFPTPAPPPPPKDTTPPTLKLGALGALKLSARKALTIPVACTDGTGCTVSVVVKAKRAVLCKAGRRLTTGRTAKLGVACSKAGAATIRRAGRKGLPVTITVTATDAAGNTARTGRTGRAR